jgi:Asp-tRNA(Asn)/Glu-tRNA(Gln) amidotransferase A subunit family amidase
MERRMWIILCLPVLMPTDDPDFYRDAPIGLQCIGKKHEEEAVIRCAIACISAFVVVVLTPTG